MKKTIGFVTSGLKFNGNTVNEQALGGSESALIYMAREMARLNNDVTVYCDCDKPGWYDGVEYRSVEQYTKDNKSQFDTLIVSRFTDFLAMPVDSKMNILWCHDIDTGHFRDAIGCSDRIFCLSDFHKKLYVDNYDIDPTNYVWKTSNGYDQEIVTTPVPWEQKKNNYIYASRPERGLKLLLEKIWPEIVERNPDAVLSICTYEHTLALPDDVKKIHKEVEDLMEYSRNIKKLGHLPKRQFYELLANSAYMVYPTSFPEISCISAIEAQYNGCLVITSDEFALSETVKTDTKVKSDEYGSLDYVNKFLAHLDKYQGDVYEAEVAKGKKAIESYAWNRVAKSWNSEIDFMFNRRHDKYKDKIIDQLVYNSDIVAAWKLTGDEKYRKLLDLAKETNLTDSWFNTETTNRDEHFPGRVIDLLELVKAEVKDSPNKKLKILDLGSNDGILSLPLLKNFSDNIESVTMYDSSKDVLDFVKKTYGHKYPQIKTVVDDVRNVLNYDFEPDIVILGEILEHVEETQQFLEFLMKLAKKNTLFYFTVPMGPWEQIVRRRDEEIHHVHHFELTDIQTIFKNVNLNIAFSGEEALGRRGEMCSNWMFWFRVSEGDNIEFGEVDYQDKWLKTRPYKTISTCMIVRDEEDNISRCLKTVKNFADEIIIVDTGSTDDTKLIASKFTDKIYDLEWKEDDGLGNFARARNYSISLATGDYIFWIDADEELENGMRLFKYIISDYYDGILLRQVQAMSKKSHANGVNIDVMHDRFFRNNIGIQFTGVIHEYPSRNDEDFLGNKMFWQDHIYVIHYGLANQETLKRKALRRNADLIYKNVRVYPKRIFARHYIMVDYWSQFITGHPNPDLQWLEKGMDIWHNDLKKCGDDWTIRLSLGVLQHYYSYCAENGIAFKGKLPEKVAFQNGENGETLEFYVVDKEEESDFFLHYLANFKRP